MIDALIRFCLNNRGFTALLLAALVGTGVYSLVNLPIDAVPDITNVQVMALTDAPALGPEEIEQFITIPVENAMNGIPRIQEVRSISQFGLSLVTIVFDEGTDIYWARQQVGERLTQARAEIPEEFGRPEMGPIATGLGEILLFEVKNAPGAKHPRSAMELRTILDWEVARQLKSVPGVIEVNAFGGELMTYQVQIDPDLMSARGISTSRVLDALRRNNANAGGGYIQRNGEMRVIRGEGILRDLKGLEEVVLDTTPNGTPIYVRDIGRAVNAPMIRNGAVSRDGRGEAVTATVMLLAGENSRTVVNRVKAKLDEIQARLPEGVVIDTFYDRSDLINRTIATVARNLAEGGVLVVVVLLVLLGNLRAGLIVASAIPMSMLFANNLMLYFGVAGSLMSLGAIDFGLIVDSAVIAVENCVGHLAHASPRARAVDVISRAMSEVRKPVVSGVAIITLVHLPILALEGVEGKMFRPMALTVIFALTGSLLLTLTAVPVLASFFLKPGMSERDTLPIRLAKRAYQPILNFALRSSVPLAIAAALMLAATVPVAMRLGGEFIPKLDEGDIVFVVTNSPSAGLNESLADADRIEKAIRAAYPAEVKSVVSRIGRPEIGLDPAGVNRTDVFVFLNDPEEWEKVHEKEELISGLERLARETVPGAMFNFSQPIEMRFNELLSGVRADLGIALYGEDLHTLQIKADAIASTLRSIPGAADVTSQIIEGLPSLQIVVDRDRIARHGINASDVLDAVATLGGKTVGQVVVGQRRFALQVRFGRESRSDVAEIRALKIADPQGRMIPLADLTEIRSQDGTYEIWRKDRQRRAMVSANVRGRDLATFVSEAQRRVGAEVPLARGYRLEWGGTFENLQSAVRRLAIVVPVAMALIFVMLFGTFHSVRLSALIFLSVPFATTGGVMALALRGLNFSISAGVGFIALSGVAVLDGLVLVASIRQYVEEGLPVEEAVRKAAEGRLRPILMTATVASLGLLPMALGHGAGAEVQRPLATVVIGGLMTAVTLQLVVLPAIYNWFDPGLPAGHGTEPEGDAPPPAAAHAHA